MPELPDDRVVLDREEPKPEAQELDLEDSIDALLEEVDATCASVENPKAGKPAREAPAATPEVEGDGAADAASDDETASTAGEVREDALEALDRVEEKTQELLEDTIDELLKDAPEPETSAPVEAEPESAADTLSEVEPESEPAASVETPEPVAEPISEPASEPVEEVEALADSLMDEAELDAQLDALDTRAPETPATETPEAAVVAPEDEPSETPAVPEALESPEAMIDQIAEELTGVSTGSETAPEAEEAEAEAQDRGDATPQASVSETSETQAETISDAIDDVLSSDATGTDDTLSSPPADSSVDEMSSTLEDLDATLAGVGDELMGDFETPEGDRISSESLQDGNDASALLEQLGLDDISIELPKPKEPVERATVDAAAAVKEQRTAPAPAKSEPHGTPQPAAAPKSTAVAPQRPMQQRVHEAMPLIDEPEGEVESIWQSARRIAVERSQQAMELARTHAGPIGARLVLDLNKPIKERPAELRNSIGYLALWTLLLAMILWVYLVFVRTTPTPTPTQAPSRMLQPGEIVDPLRANNSMP